MPEGGVFCTNFRNDVLKIEALRVFKNVDIFFIFLRGSAVGMQIRKSEERKKFKRIFQKFGGKRGGWLVAGKITLRPHESQIY